MAQLLGVTLLFLNRLSNMGIVPDKATAFQSAGVLNKIQQRQQILQLTNVTGIRRIGRLIAAIHRSAN